jgi:hypothetical protein
VRAAGTWMVGAMILCRPKKSQWQRGCPPPRVRQGGVRERREEGFEEGGTVRRGMRDRSSLMLDVVDNTMVDRVHESTVV